MLTDRVTNGGRYIEEGDIGETAMGQKRTKGETWMKVDISTKLSLYVTNHHVM